MLKIAIIQFPGLNTEYETRREINRAGMRGEFFRWNEDPKKLSAFDGYVIGGGFSYEDRGRAGVIASLDPIMDAIKAEATKGKPVLGICNGAQILVESGLIPGADGNKLAMALARNKRMQNGAILGTGYYNDWVHLKCTAEKDNCMFTKNFKQGEIVRAPIAHGEGRFTTDIAELMPMLMAKGQLPFRYSDAYGVMSADFPINPNGAMFNAAAICNPAGNVMGVMPHFERDSGASEKLFTSMRDSLMERKAGSVKKRLNHIAVQTPKLLPLANYTPTSCSVQVFISLIITDNEAETFEMTLQNLGFTKVTLKRRTHIELEYSGKPDLQKLLRKLIQSGVLLNTNKEVATVKLSKERLRFDAKREKFLPIVDASRAASEEPCRTYRFLVREKPDFVGVSRLATIQKRLKFEEITNVKTGTLWEINIPTKSKTVAEDEFKKLISTHLFWNPHGQEAMLI